MSSSQGQSFGKAQPSGRYEDARLITGHGTYAGDVSVEGQLYAYFVRSDVAHGEILSIDTSAAVGMPGVIGVFTGEDLKKAGIEGLPYLPITGYAMGVPVDTPRPALATGRVRYVGEQIVMIVAETYEQATEAGEQVYVEIEHLPMVVDVEEAIQPGAPQLWPEAGLNTVLTYAFGDAEVVAKAFDSAAHITTVKLRNNRVLANPMELRSVIAAYDTEEDVYKLTVASQGVSYYHRGLSEGTLRIPPAKAHIRTHDVGGAFGNKEFPYPEDIALLHAARFLGRTVKWTGTRTEHFLSDNHARDASIEARLALDENGRFLAIHADILTSLGAYCSYVAPNTAIRNTTIGLAQVYRTPVISTQHKIVVTNCTPVGPYRGAGREQGALIVESLVDKAARELGIDPAELRRRNLIPVSEMPYLTPLGRTYDSGDFEGVLDKTLALADWSGFAERKANSRLLGKVRGRGLAMFLEAVGGAPMEGAKLKFQADGTVHVILAAQSSGQGHETTFAQIVAERLQVPYARVRVVQGDSRTIPRGNGSFASRTMFMAGTATAMACDEVIAKGAALAATVLQVPVESVDFRDGIFRTSQSTAEIGVLELAEALRGQEGLAEALDAGAEFFAKEFNFPNGCHICELEIDPDTGVIEVDRYVAVDDCGVVINPTIVHGQVHGGVAQGIGQALREHIRYDDSGQLVTATFQDYAMPRAADYPEPIVDFHAVPSPTNPLGTKGVGEAGVTGSVAAVSNAVHDALARLGCTAPIDMPFTSERVWRVLNAIAQ